MFHPRYCPDIVRTHNVLVPKPRSKRVFCQKRFPSIWTKCDLVFCLAVHPVPENMFGLDELATFNNVAEVIPFWPFSELTPIYLTLTYLKPASHYYQAAQTWHNDVRVVLAWHYH